MTLASQSRLFLRAVRVRPNLCARDCLAKPFVDERSGSGISAILCGALEHGRYIRSWSSGKSIPRQYFITYIAVARGCALGISSCSLTVKTFLHLSLS